MINKTLLTGIGSFMAGGLLVSIAAVTFEKDNTGQKTDGSTKSSMQMSSDSLKDKSGDDFDKAFISEMIGHHEGAVEMAKLSKKQAKHDEIKQLSEAIILAQETEITEMKKWHMEWGYGNTNSSDHTEH